MRKSLLDSICSTRSLQRCGSFSRFVVADVESLTDICVVGFGGNIDRTINCSKQDSQTAGVIAVFVCDQNSVETLNVFADERESARDLFGAESGVNENASFACNDQNRIAS